MNRGSRYSIPEDCAEAEGMASTTVPCEDNPMRVHVPIVITVGLIAIDFLHLSGFSCLQVQKPLVAFVMPDGEIPVVHQREHDILAVVAWTRPGEALPHRHCVE